MNIQLKYKLCSNRCKLTLLADEGDRKLLAEMKEDGPDYFGTYACEAEVLEHLVCNSELDWVRPEECGDLTDAPMLGIRDDAGTVTERWGYMDYQVRSFVYDLLVNGEAVFVS